MIQHSIQTMSDLPTEKQLGFLRKRNYSGPAPSTKQEASDIISKILGDIPQKPFAKGNQQQTVFGGATTEKEVKWEKPTDEILAQYDSLLRQEQEYESLAFEITRTLHPEMSVNSQTFGMIVSAKQDKLIQLSVANRLAALKEALDKNSE